ncbi:MAG TPA: type VI secretion system baseplate subunit TssK [Gemmatimonadaceae bacterium]|nr:type VI secretion system baseplate subunit TssK [Gemmatimonadaceae bacterium]
MRQMQPVLWTKGVLLSPQHFQTQDRFLEDLLEFQLSALAFCPWGFQRLEIDREALASGTFALSSASGILPDGLLFDMPLSEAAPLPKPLEGAFEPDQEWLDVYLGIPEYRYGGRNVSGMNRERDARYRAEELLRRDETTGQAERPIQVARRNFRILFAGESLEGTSALRMARVTRSATGEYHLDTRFIPPLIDIEASDYVMSIGRRLVEILSARSTALASTRRQKNQSLAEFGIADVASFWLLYTINSFFPELRHIYETRRGHPAELYRAMLALTGALTTFSGTIHPRDLPAYEHDNLSSCFTKLDAQLRELLETVVPATAISIPMKLVSPSVYAAALDQEKYLAAPQIYLAVSIEGRGTDVSGRAPHLLKIAAAAQLDNLIRQALPGVPLTYVPNPPSAVSVKLNHHYFLLQKSGAEWDGIARARNVAAYVPAEFVNPQLELVIILPKA